MQQARSQTYILGEGQANFRGCKNSIDEFYIILNTTKNSHRHLVFHFDTDSNAFSPIRISLISNFNNCFSKNTKSFNNMQNWQSVKVQKFPLVLQLQ